MRYKQQQQKSRRRGLRKKSTRAWSDDRQSRATRYTQSSEPKPPKTTRRKPHCPDPQGPLLITTIRPDDLAQGMLQHIDTKSTAYLIKILNLDNSNHTQQINITYKKLTIIRIRRFQQRLIESGEWEIMESFSLFGSARCVHSSCVVKLFFRRTTFFFT